MKHDEITVGAIVECMTHRWKIEGVYLGALGTESLIELSNINHRNGNDGPRKVRRMFVPEALVLAGAYLPDGEPSRSRADARLIAAAPLLLEALLMQEELAALRMPGDTQSNIALVRDRRRKAIAAALGQTP